MTSMYYNITHLYNNIMYGGVDEAAATGTYRNSTIFETLIAPTCFTVKSRYTVSPDYVRGPHTIRVRLQLKYNNNNYYTSTLFRTMCTIYI